MKKSFLLIATLTMLFFSGCSDAIQENTHESTQIKNLKNLQETTIDTLKKYDKKLEANNLAPRAKKFIFKKKIETVEGYFRTLELSKKYAGETIPECFNQLEKTCK